MVDNGRAEGYERAVPHGAFLVKRSRMRVLRRSIPGLVFLASGALAASCGGDDFCSQGSYECTGGTQPSTAGFPSAGGTSGDGLGGSTGTGGFAASPTAGFPSVGGTSGSGEAGTETGGTSSGGAPTGGTMGDSGNAGEGGEAGAAAAACADPDSPTARCVLDVGAAGIYVAPSGSDDNDGTQSAPVASITHALELAGAYPVPIFVCAGTYQEHVEVTTNGTSLHGAYTCDNATWTYDPTVVSRIAPTSKDEALRVKDVTGLTVMDMELASANATDAGASSVAVFVSGAQAVTFVRDHIVAGDGVKGDDGVLEPYTYPDSSSLRGIDATSDTGAAAMDSCVCEGATVMSAGGPGGSVAQDGGVGQPDLGGGAGGMRGTACTSGGGGGNAPAAADGNAARTRGAIDLSGWLAAAGEDGQNGAPGQGGGGGGGGKTSGDGGGGGGACGGCGGKGGPGGTGGGASIAVLVLASQVRLDSCILQTGTAGNGGAGIGGQAGQDGGAHGNGFNMGCSGGNGGRGGDGGAGGGGAGGISVGIVSAMMSTINFDETTTYLPGTAGVGGRGAGADNNGLSGVTQKALGF